MLAVEVVDWVGVVVGAGPSSLATWAASSEAGTSSGDEGAELEGTHDPRQGQQVGQLHEARRHCSVVVSFSWGEFEPSAREPHD